MLLLKILSFVFCLSTVVKSQSIDIFQIMDALMALNIDPHIINTLSNLNLTNFHIGMLCDYVNLVNKNVSDLCIRQLNIVCSNEKFLAHMIDASSKFPYSGLLLATRLDYGSYEECINLEIKENDTRVLGKHCTGGFMIPTSSIPDGFEILNGIDFSNMEEFINTAFKLSTCTPDGCSSADLLHLFNIPPEFPVFNEIACSTKERWSLLEWDSIAVISFLLFVAFLMVLSTCYDVYGYYTVRKSPHLILLAFSVFSNGKSLFKTSNGNNSDQILVFHGLKAISIMWITAGHCFAGFNNIIVDNDTEPREWEWTRQSFYITSGHLAVDTFFFISGFLGAYHYLKAVENKSFKDQIKNVPYMVLHRYLRLTPVLLASFLVFMTFYRYTAMGPTFRTGVDALKEPCNKYWWSLLLYVQNYVNYDQVCMIQTWYLSADMQLFLVTPILLIPISLVVKKHFRWVFVQLVILHVLVTVLPIALKFVFQVYNNEYETHARLNIYLTGIMVGIFMRANKGFGLKISRIKNLIIWIIVLTLMTAVLQAFKEIQLIVHNENNRKNDTYFIMLKPFWGIGLSWIVYSCHNGYGGIINWFLTRPVFQILSKLTYSIYLLHIMVYCHTILSYKTRIHFTELWGINTWISGFVWTTLISVFWTLAFESPILVIEKVIFGKVSREGVKLELSNDRNGKKNGMQHRNTENAEF